MKFFGVRPVLGVMTTYSDTTAKLDVYLDWELKDDAGDALESRHSRAYQGGRGVAASYVGHPS